MKETNVTPPLHINDDNAYIIETAENATELFSPRPYKKYLPKMTPALRQLFLHATGEIKYQAIIDYMFQALLQENEEALINLICSTLHWSRSKIKSVEITNPIVLGKYIKDKTFILDIKALLNDDTIINLEMQLNDYGNWPERSLGYLCRNFDNLNKGDNYINTKTAIHIGFLNFTLFPHTPEFHAIYKMQNVKNHNVYTDKFMLHVIELNNIELATEEDHAYGIDKWASFFKAKTWEDIRMIVDNNPALQSAAETLYQLNMDEQFRETCDRFIRAEAEKNALHRIKAELTQANEALTAENADKDCMIAEKNAEIADKNAEIAELKARLALLEKATDK